MCSWSTRKKKSECGFVLVVGFPSQVNTRFCCHIVHTWNVLVLGTHAVYIDHNNSNVCKSTACASSYVFPPTGTSCSVERFKTQRGTLAPTLALGAPRLRVTAPLLLESVGSRPGQLWYNGHYCLLTYETVM